MARRLRVLTQSSLTTLAQCEERFRLSVIERMRPMEDRPYFDIGTAVHAGLEHRDPEEGVTALLRARGPAWTDGERSIHVRDSWVVRAMVLGALRRWSDWPERAEVRFNVPITNPATGRASRAHRLGGIIDGVYDGGSLLEIKTASRIDEFWMQ